MNIVRSALAGLVIAMPAAVWAQGARDTSLTNYIDVGVGNGNVSLDCTGSTSCHRSNTAVLARVGHRFDPSWALELVYADVDAGLFSFFERAARVKGYGVGAAYTLPVSDTVDLALRAGVWSTRSTYQAGLGESGQRVSTSAVAPAIGLGGSWQFAQQWRLNLNADFTRTDLRYLSNGAKDRIAVRLVTAGVSFSF